MKKFTMRSLFSILYAAGVLSLPTQTFASGFQLWEQDDAGIGNFHAGYAATANDATTAFYNPAGITRIKNQQLVFGTAAVVTDIKFNGTVAVNTLKGGATQGVTAQGGSGGFVPDLHYVAPITDKIGFGFSIDAPFGAKMDYGRDTILRYTSFRTMATIIDISPALGWQLTDQFSMGLGADVQKMQAEFDEVGRLSDAAEADSLSKASDTACGFHFGGLYQFSPDTRVGLSYHSKVVHHLTGTSKFIGTLANAINGGPIVSMNARANINLPPYTALSLYHRVNPKWAVLGSVIYTQWSVMKQLILQNVAGINVSTQPSTDLVIILPTFYRNTWNASIGADYYVTDDITLRAGAGYDQSPAKNAYRNIELPDNDRYAVALGGHYQATKTIGVDLGWTHLFVRKAGIHNITQVTGAQTVTTDGSVTASADVYGAQLVWDIT